MTDKDGRFLAELYLDFFPRATKRGGAWETEFRSVSIVEEHETRPLVSLVMNFTKPTDTTPSLLTFSEFETFLHEFGHALHAILSEESTSRSAVRTYIRISSSCLRRSWRIGRPRKSSSTCGP